MSNKQTHIDNEEFTQGEWEINLNARSNGLVPSEEAFSIGNSEWAICAVWKDAGYDGESLANAHLIATAPDLYKELKKIHQLLARFGSSWFTNQDLASEVYRTHKTRADVLKKALGGGHKNG